MRCHQGYAQQIMAKGIVSALNLKRTKWPRWLQHNNRDAECPSAPAPQSAIRRPLPRLESLSLLLRHCLLFYRIHRQSIMLGFHVREAMCQECMNEEKVDCGGVRYEILSTSRHNVGSPA